MAAGRFRPKRFPEGTLLIFLALLINIIVTFLGILPLGSVGRLVVYYLFLAISAVIFLLWLIGKYTFLCCRWNIRPCCADICNEIDLSGKVGKCCYCLGSCLSKSMLYDVAFCFMALFYLTGDNLKQMVCTEDSSYCPFIGQAFTWASLLLNIFLTLLKASGSKPNIPSTFPVIGVMGDVYDKLLQIAAQALTIDQGITTILESVDIPRLIGNTTLNERTAAIQDNTAIKIMAGVCGGVVLLLLVVLFFLCCANLRLCCTCKKVKWYECFFGEWFCAFFVVSFVILFLMGDIDWIYDFYNDGTDTITRAKGCRIAFLVPAFLSIVVLISYYVCGICLPGLSVALEKDEYFLPEEADTGMKVDQRMVRKQYNEWKTEESAEVFCGNKKRSYLKGKIKVEDHFGKTNITVRVNEEITCWEAFKHLKENLKERVSTMCDGGDDPDYETNWTVQAYICKGEPDGIQVGKKQQAASGASAPSSKREVIEMKQKDMDSSICDTSSSAPRFSAVSGCR